MESSINAPKEETKTKSHQGNTKGSKAAPNEFQRTLSQSQRSGIDAVYLEAVEPALPVPLERKKMLERLANNLLDDQRHRHEPKTPRRRRVEQANRFLLQANGSSDAFHWMEHRTPGHRIENNMEWVDEVRNLLDQLPPRSLDENDDDDVDFVKRCMLRDFC